MYVVIMVVEKAIYYDVWYLLIITAKTRSITQHLICILPYRIFILRELIIIRFFL